MVCLRAESLKRLSSNRLPHELHEFVNDLKQNTHSISLMNIATPIFVMNMQDQQYALCSNSIRKIDGAVIFSQHNPVIYRQIHLAMEKLGPISA